MTKAVIGFKTHAIATKKNIIILIAIYFGYLGVFLQLFNDSYSWAYAFVSKNQFSQMLGALSTLIFSKGVLGGIVLAVAGSLFGNTITDKNIRDENIRSQIDETNKENNS